MAEYKTRLPERKYSEAEYLFQTIEMAKSDEEYDICTTPPEHADNVEQAATIFSWKLVKHRRPHRRYTTHGYAAPPAPPSTPTSLTASSTPIPSPTASSNITAEEDPLNSLLYILDYAPKYKKKLKEQQRTDAELAELFNVVTITSSSGNCRSSGSVIDENRSSSSSKLPPERGISAASRVIRKHDASTKIFKIHRNPKEFFREPDEEDSVSAPEYDTDDIQEDIRYRLMRFKSSRRLLQTKRHRRFARFEHQVRVNAMVDNFDAAMSFNDA